MGSEHARKRWSDEERNILRTSVQTHLKKCRGLKIVCRFNSEFFSKLRRTLKRRTGCERDVGGIAAQCRLIREELESEAAGLKAARPKPAASPAAGGAGRASGSCLRGSPLADGRHGAAAAPAVRQPQGATPSLLTVFNALGESTLTQVHVKDQRFSCLSFKASHAEGLLQSVKRWRAQPARRVPDGVNLATLVACNGNGAEAYLAVIDGDELLTQLQSSAGGIGAEACYACVVLSTLTMGPIDTDPEFVGCLNLVKLYSAFPTDLLLGLHVGRVERGTCSLFFSAGNTTQQQEARDAGAASNSGGFKQRAENREAPQRARRLFSGGASGRAAATAPAADGVARATGQQAREVLMEALRIMPQQMTTPLQRERALDRPGQATVVLPNPTLRPEDVIEEKPSPFLARESASAPARGMPSPDSPPPWQSYHCADQRHVWRGISN